MILHFCCSILGHKWKYKDYTFSINTIGDSYKFSASRFCTRCEKKEYKFTKWLDEKFVPEKELDF